MKKKQNKKNTLLTSVLIIIGIAIIVLSLNVFNTNANVVNEKDNSFPIFTFAAAGDHAATKVTNSSLRKLAQSQTDFYLALGDLSYLAKGKEESWCKHVKSFLGENYPFELISGNHEDQKGKMYENGDILKFAKCLPNRLSITGNYPAQYYFDYNNLTRIIMISPDLKINGTYYNYSKGKNEYVWLNETISEAQNANISWIIVGMHSPCISMGVKKCEIGPDLPNLLISQKVDLVLQAHEHSYQRSKQLKCMQVNKYNASCVTDNGTDNLYQKGNGTIFLIVGTFGHALNEIFTGDTEAPYFVKWQGKYKNPTHGFMKYTVSENSINAEFVRTYKGTFNDNFTISV